MGLLDEYAIDLNEVETPDFDRTLPDDIYEFTVGDIRLKEGSKKNPEQNFIIITYLLGENGHKHDELFTLPLDPRNPTDKELTKLSFYKQRLASLGFSPDQMNTIDESDVVGITGTLELRTTVSKANGQEYQNIKRLQTESSAAAKPAVAGPKKAATAVDNPFA